ncbi:COX15/CtaA family protein [Natronomonas gomsonensis]|jgi:cytochrome c oxidase assembly protein subunit 15|uniref:COX15/CtaA family protein n=1 Tax=Natronomonas gomsonensis TaxID=1046043 RepID=UPI0020CA6F9F|nr:COX15/CtaA family protein [Natronomonas gomsonensis]MCY4731236.1 COX15/CtaA family protein [Natronomonas gomsonensis]
MDFRRLLLVTTVTTALTALVGVITATSGAGLTCEARWPLCDGAVFGLFPANFMSFIEWSHRLVAMITGFLIIGSTIAAWRGGHSRRIRFATLAALLLTPVQIVFGAFTVLVNELVFGYSIVVLTLHFTFASLILAFLVGATVWAYADVSEVTFQKIQTAAVAALLGFPVMVGLTPRLFVAFGEIAQFVYYGLGFAMFAALCLVALWSRELGARAVAYAGGVGAALVVSQLVIARRAFGNDGQLLILAISLAAFGLTLVAIRRTRALGERSRAAAPMGD